MNRSLWIAALALLSSLGAAPRVLGQAGYVRPPTGPGARPTTSPYLNLTRPGNSALNYYNLVRPEFEFRNANQALQGQIGRQGQSIRDLQAEGIPATGHSTSFFNYSHFFPGAGGQGVTRTFGAAATGPRPQGSAGARPTPGGRR